MHGIHFAGWVIDDDGRNQIIPDRHRALTLLLKVGSFIHSQRQKSSFQHASLNLNCAERCAFVLARKFIRDSGSRDGALLTAHCGVGLTIISKNESRFVIASFFNLLPPSVLKISPI